MNIPLQEHSEGKSCKFVDNYNNTKGYSGHQGLQITLWVQVNEHSG